MALRKNIDAITVDELLWQYKDLKINQPNNFNFEDEGDLNQIGYDLMNKKRLDDTIQLFELNGFLVLLVGYGSLM